VGLVGEDMFGSRVFGAVLIAAAGVAAVTAVLAAPSLMRAARPFARQVLKRGMEGYARVRGAAAELVEDVEDLVAEVQAELKQARPSKAAAAPSSQHAQEV
jgi:Protein of unknown function (DUF5132)